jgi:hypothetical protein
MSTKNTKSMRFGLSILFNMAMLDLSTHRTSGLCVGLFCLHNSLLIETYAFLVLWSDYARDILNFVLHFLPEEPTPSALPTCLQRVPLEISEAREKRGFATRKLIAVGHSFGGCAASVLATFTSSFPSDTRNRLEFLPRTQLWRHFQVWYSLTL